MNTQLKGYCSSYGLQGVSDNRGAQSVAWPLGGRAIECAVHVAQQAAIRLIVGRAAEKLRCRDVEYFASSFTCSLTIN